VIQYDSADPLPAFEQIRSQVAGQILTGEIPVGTRLPPVRQLAADLGIAPGTVARAYTLLETDGLIESRGPRGTYVRIGVEHYPELLGLAADFAAAARERGITLDEALFAIRAGWRSDQNSVDRNSGS
jgi:GntR family transcriptional regulator